MTCFHCGAETSNGLALCERCRAAVLVDLEFLPIYFRNLSRWRPSSTSGRRVPSSREPQNGARGRDDYVSRALDEAGTALTARARRFAADRPAHSRVVERILTMEEERCFRLLCALFERRLTTLATLPWAGELVKDIRTHEAALRYHTERAVPGWYAGACARCKAATFVVPGLTWVTCGGCGTTTYARDRLEVILNEARDWVARPMRIAEAIVSLIDGELSIPRLHKRISKWGERGQITQIRRLDDEGDEIGPKHYRLGEVLDTLYAEGPTRLDTTPVTSVAS